MSDGYCECGCGGKAPIAMQTSRRRGHVKGEPLRFIAGHYARVIPRRSVEERFWEKVAVAGPDDCWEWTAATVAGYGVLQAGSRSAGLLYAHRLSFTLHSGALSDDEDVLHTCDNPPCVNPAHLFTGTAQDNAVDMVAKGRARPVRGERHCCAKLTEAQVLRIRREYDGTPGDGEIVSLARQYGVTKSTISGVLRRRTWAWL